MIFQIVKDYKEIGVTVLLCQVRRRLKIMIQNNMLIFVLSATVYQQLKRMSYMEVAGKENIHVTINDAVMHALKAVRIDCVSSSLHIQNHFLFLACFS